MSFGIPVRNGVMLGLTASTALSTRGGFPVPALSLNFLSGTLDSRITFTRALNTATRVNSSGLIETVNANIPRFDYDPVTLQPRGLLIEEARTNVILHSEDLGNAAWVKYAGTTITTNAAISPAGSSTADLMYPATSGTNRGVYQAFTGGNLTYTQSIYVKNAGKNFVAFYDFEGATYAGSVDLTTGSTASVKAGYTITPTQAGSGWWRITVTATTTTGTRYLTMIVVDAASSASVTANGTDGVFVWGGQTEVGAFATSYIPTVASTVARNADVPTMTGTNFSGWYNPSEGTFVTFFSMLALNTATTQELLALDDGSVANSIALRANNTAGDTSSTASVAGVSQGFLNIAGAAAGVTQKVAHGIKLNDAALVRNGGTVVTDTTYAVPPGQIRMAIGQRTTNFAQLNGHIRSITYFNVRLPNDRLQALTR